MAVTQKTLNRRALSIAFCKDNDLPIRGDLNAQKRRNLMRQRGSTAAPGLEYAIVQFELGFGHELLGSEYEKAFAATNETKAALTDAKNPGFDDDGSEISVDEAAVEAAQQAYDEALAVLNRLEDVYYNGEAELKQAA